MKLATRRAELTRLVVGRARRPGAGWWCAGTARYP